MGAPASPWHVSCFGPSDTAIPRVRSAGTLLCHTETTAHACPRLWELFLIHIHSNSSCTQVRSQPHRWELASSRGQGLGCTQVAGPWVLLRQGLPRVGQ